MKIAVLGCCAIVLLASGCGSGSTSPAAFRTRADSICRRLGLQTGSGVSTKAALDRHIRRAEEGIDRLARLHPPSGDEHSYHDLVATLKQTMVLARTRFPALIEAKQPSRRSVEWVVRPLEREIRRADRDARAAGVGACAKAISGGPSASSGGSNGPTPQQVESPAKRAFDRQMIALSKHYAIALGKAGVPFTKAFAHGHGAVEKAALTMSRENVRIYDEEASAIARVEAPADARAEQQAIADAYRVAAKQEGEFAVSYRHHGHTSLPQYLRVDWQGHIDAALRRLDAKGYALGDFEGPGTLVAGTSKIVDANQP